MNLSFGNDIHAHKTTSERNVFANFLDLTTNYLEYNVLLKVKENMVCNIYDS